MARSPRRFSAIAKRRNVEEVNRLVRSGRSIRSACLSIGIHSNQYHRWKGQLKAFNSGDATALEAKSKKPKILARKTTEEEIEIIIELARSGEYCSANAVTQDAKKVLGRSITTGTVIKILKESGDYGIVEVKDKDGRVVKRKSGLIKNP